jgi:hypothetical protein
LTCVPSPDQGQSILACLRNCAITFCEQADRWEQRVPPWVWFGYPAAGQYPTDPHVQSGVTACRAPVSQNTRDTFRCHGILQPDGYWGALHPLTNPRYTLRTGADKRVTIRSLLDCTIIRSISCNSAVNSVCLSKDGRCACMSQCICLCVIASLCRTIATRALHAPKET